MKSEIWWNNDVSDERLTRHILLCTSNRKAFPAGLQHH